MAPKQLIIPPRPDVLSEIQNEISTDDPCVATIANLIKKDVSLYSVLLSAVNSPLMGLQQSIDSAENAIAIMGLKRLFNMLQAVIVRSCFTECQVLESFWKTASEVASINSGLARKLNAHDPDQAFTAGMLHNVGIPIMLQNFDEYGDFLKQNDHKAANELCVLERQKFDTDHYLQGALMAKTWYMPEDVSLAIRYQPIATGVLTYQKELPASVAKLIAITALAKSISNEYRHYWKLEEEDPYSEIIVASAMDYLQLCDTDFAELKEDYLEKISASEAV